MHVSIELTATAPIHHGAGTSGNTALMRLQDIVLPDGTPAKVPFVSGNSIRHKIRAALAWLLVADAGIADGALSKACVDLLWSGGALTQAGAQTDLVSMRDRHALLPMLPLLGYSHGPDIVTGALRATHVHLWCAENAWRMADPGVPAVPAADWLAEEFGTRHDVDGSAVDRIVEDVMLSPTKTTQMIYDFQVVLAGSRWTLGLSTEAATPAEDDALAAALVAVTDSGWTLGAKTAQGYGACDAVLIGASDADLRAAAARHREHTVGHAAAIRDLLTGLR
jgi:hypothetical protein